VPTPSKHLWLVDWKEPLGSGYGILKPFFREFLMTVQTSASFFKTIYLLNIVFTYLGAFR
jgi:hypothetical protein